MRRCGPLYKNLSYYFCSEGCKGQFDTHTSKNDGQENPDTYGRFYNSVRGTKKERQTLNPTGGCEQDSGTHTEALGASYTTAR